MKARRWSMPSWGILITFSLLFLLVFADGGTLVVQARSITLLGSRITIERAIGSSVTTIFLAFIQAESDQRGYILTRQQSYLDAYTKDITIIPSQLTHLQQIVLDSTESHLVTAFIVACDTELTNIQTVTTLIDHNDLSGATSEIASDQQALDAINSIGTRIRTRLTVIITTLTNTGISEAWILLGTIIIAFLGNLILVPLAYTFVVRAFARQKAIIIERTEMTQRLQEEQRLKNDFINIAGHELRTPVAICKGNVQLVSVQLRQTIESRKIDPMLLTAFPSMRRLLTRADESLDRLNRLIGDLLDISRIDAESFPIHCEHASLITIVSEMVEEQQLLWTNRTLYLRLDAPHLPDLWIDPDRIRQVITNLISNALKYSDGDITITVSHDDDMAMVCVADTGPGLTEIQQRHLFERFSRVEGIQALHTSRMGFGSGMGLGLYICRTIIERHGGTVGVMSSVGNGSTFWFRLPIPHKDENGTETHDTGEDVPLS